MDINEILKSLTYASYKHNRIRSPDLSVKDWAVIFGEKQAKQFEELYQLELKLGVI